MILHCLQRCWRFCCWLEVINEEATPLGLEINRLKTKIQEIGKPPHTKTSVARSILCNAQVELVESFVYLGSAQHRKRSGDTEIRRRIAIAHDCMTQLNCHGSRQFRSVQRFVCTGLHSASLAVLLCDSCRTVNKQLPDRIDAFDMWFLKQILHIPYTRHVTNEEVSVCHRLPSCLQAGAYTVEKQRVSYMCLSRLAN